MAKPAKPRHAFSDADAERLDGLLYPRIEHGGLPFEAVDGLLSSVAVGPETILPSEWLPLILGEHSEPWQTEAEAGEFTDLVMRLYNHIVQRVASEPDNAAAVPYIALPEDFDGLDADAIDAIDLPIGGNWAVGFMIGVGLRGAAWDALAAADEDLLDDLDMIVALMPEDPGDALPGTEDSEAEPDLPATTPDDGAEAREDRPLRTSERLEIIIDLAAALHHMNRVRLDSLAPREPVRREMKIGRNDPCPCGSGQKFKKCHGAHIN